jgi:general secretion pathway protein K
MTTTLAIRNKERQASDGFIVVAVLWMLAGLSALVSVYAAYVIQTAAGFAMQEDQLRVRALTSAAIELTAFAQLSLSAQERPTSGLFNFRLGAATVAVEFRSEAARIDLNAAPKPLLAGLFALLGEPPAAAESYADRVIGWRTPAAPGNDSEALVYQRTGYQPRGGKFPHVNELALVRGIPAALIERALNYVTVYSARPQLNVFDAAPELVAAVPGITSEQINAVIAARRATPDIKKRVLGGLGPAQQFATADASKTFRTAVDVALDNGLRAKSEVVILIDRDQAPFSILSWRDGV